MGCDGGTIPTRDELVKTKKKPEQKDKNSELAFRWKHCAISQEKLVQPIVACELGRLYNKESILKVFIDKTELSPMFRHLRGMRDIKKVNLTENPAKSSNKMGTGDGYVDSGISDYICPVVGLEMSGKYKFCLLWSCGCVLSERALKEVKSKVCHKCGQLYTADDVIKLNTSEDEEKILEDKMVARRALAKAAKKSKKSVMSKSHAQTASNDTESTASSSSGSPSEGACSSTTSPSTSAAESRKKKMDATQQHASVSSKDSSRLKVKSSTSSSSSTESSSLHAGVKRKVGIQEDPRTSKVFKSLFTSSEKAKNQQQPHWVTYNPMYY